MVSRTSEPFPVGPCDTFSQPPEPDTFLTTPEPLTLESCDTFWTTPEPLTRDIPA